jgi:hypothetical protein
MMAIKYFFVVFGMHSDDGLLNISRIFLKYGHFSFDGVNDQLMFTKQRFSAY